jgi:hypothetical protein
MKHSKGLLPPADEIKRIQGALQSDLDGEGYECKWVVFAILKSPRVESLYGHWAVGSAYGDYASASAKISNDYRLLAYSEALELYDSLLERNWKPYSHKSLVGSFEEILVRDGLKTFRPLWPGHAPPGGEYKCDIAPVRTSPLNWVQQLNHYCVFWRNPADPAKGTIWLYLSSDACDMGGIRQHEDGVSWRLLGHRPKLVLASGVVWTATWADGTSHKFKASPQANKKLMAAIATRWGNPPEKLQRDQGRPFSLHDLKEESHSHVYLVRLLTFDEAADGRSYYKIGKAISVPKRIKQFGPCELIEEAVCDSETMSLRAEAALHAQFDVFRKMGTEIFVMNAKQLEALRAAFQSIRDESS